MEREEEKDQEEHHALYSASPRVKKDLTHDGLSFVVKQFIYSIQNSIQYSFYLMWI